MFAKVLSISKPSRTVVCAGILLIVTAATADARRHGRHHSHHGFSRHVIVRVAPVSESYAYRRFERRGLEHPRVEGNQFDRRGASGRFAARGSKQIDIIALVPRDWRREPPDQNWNGERFISPAGDAWLGFYGSPADEQTRDEHLKAVAFVEGEELTYLQREQDWLAVSGFKAEKRDRIFYRKAVLACGGRQWRHFALEYPSERRRPFDSLIDSLSRALDRSAEDDCGDATVGRR